MGDEPWGEGAKDILPVPSTADKLDEAKVGACLTRDNIRKEEGGKRAICSVRLEGSVLRCVATLRRDNRATARQNGGLQ